MKKAIFCITTVVLLLSILFTIFMAYNYYKRKNSENEYLFDEPSTAQVQNSYFKQYIGQNRSPEEIRYLIKYVQEYNNNAEQNGLEKIYIEGIIFVSNVKNNKRYNVEIKDYYEDEFIKTIKISEYKRAESGDSGD